MPDFIRPTRRTVLTAAATMALGKVGLLDPNTAFADTPATPYRGNQHRPTKDLLAWQARADAEPALEPGLPIVDPHHHLFNTTTDALYYRREDMAQDLSSGHRVLGTVYIAAYGAGWRSDGPKDMRSVGEVERIVQLSAQPLATPQGPCRLAAGIVSDVDLTLGDSAAAVLEAHVAAGAGRLRGVRHYTTYHDGQLSKFIPNAPRGVMADAGFRRAFAQLERHRLNFDALVYHTQLRELAELADAFPRTTIVLNHVGMPVGVLDFASQRAEVRRDWEKDMRALARRPNVVVKVGGMGMPIFGFGFEHGDRPATTQALVQAWQPLMQVCFEAFGPARCMLESNFPVDKQSCGYGQLWNAFKRATAGLSVTERKALFYRTACQTYRLPELQAECDAAWPAA
ncbi:amidohydrolase family protein [Variovorax rhizosphaerae]|uniref:Amidohydrolase family protein n=1 Tax=Variovorax rhizosphaerae TaxID=1836200 RepID=A0ABU8WN39_9BURK